MSNPDLVQYIVEQASKAGEVNAKKMFGDGEIIQALHAAPLWKYFAQLKN